MCIVRANLESRGLLEAEEAVADVMCLLGSRQSRAAWWIEALLLLSGKL
jgi:hypothetical protein